jgi:hypothetical protein
MDDFLGNGLWQFVLDRQAEGPIEVSSEYTKYLEIAPLECDSHDKFYNLVTSVVTKPGTFNPKIFDARLEAGKALYHPNHEPTKPQMKALDKVVRDMFDKQLMPDDVEFIHRIHLKKAVLMRRYTRQDRKSYLMLEIWGEQLNYSKCFAISYFTEENLA